MRRDPLDALARLRRLETTEAKRRLGEAFGRLDGAERRIAEATATLQREVAASAPADYAAWLRRGLAERDRARIAQGLATAGAATAQGLLAEARAAERGLEQVRALRQEATDQRLKRRAQASLDEVAANRPRARPA